MSGLVAVRRWPPGMKQWLHNCTLRRFDQRPVEIMYCPCPGFASLVSESRRLWVRFSSLVMRIQGGSQLCGGTTSTIQGTPNRSVHMPNRSPHICFSNGMVTVPPSASLSQ